MKALAVGQPLDGQDFFSVRSDGQINAGVHNLAVHEDSAGPTFPVPATFLDTRQEERATTLAALDAGILARFRYTASRPSRSSGRRRRSLSGTLS